MDPPMSDWFKSAPYALDTIAYSIKFQQESMASQIRYYKSKYHQQRMYIEKIRHENAQLKQQVEMLSMQLQRMNGGYYPEEPSQTVNSNGKRRMVESQRTSSPRSAHTPLGPNRLTLPPGQQPPHLSSKTSPEQTYPTTQHQLGTRGFTDKFSYQPEISQGLRQFQRTRQNQENHGPGPPQSAAPKVKPVAPTNSRPLRQPQRNVMAPPPTPQLARQTQPNTDNNVSTNRFPTRIAPSLSVTASRVPSRAAHPNTTSQGSQRMPFVPSNRQGSYA